MLNLTALMLKPLYESYYFVSLQPQLLITISIY